MVLLTGWVVSYVFVVVVVFFAKAINCHCWCTDTSAAYILTPYRNHRPWSCIQAPDALTHLVQGQQDLRVGAQGKCKTHNNPQTTHITGQINTQKSFTAACAFRMAEWMVSVWKRLAHSSPSHLLLCFLFCRPHCNWVCLLTSMSVYPAH